MEGLCAAVKTHDEKTDRQMTTLMLHNKKDKESHLRTQEQLENASEILEKMATDRADKEAGDIEFKKIVETWMMNEITANRKGFLKANAKLLIALGTIITALFGTGILISVFGG